ncbi:MULTISPECIES: hypothetical protein [unclassified Massilia]|uniref:hypothetical protein n=1 Tax=unclassified Massilia TaxID=2609279 RepID=UPI001780F93E|nr:MULTISPECIES: hypothetical protein [unclassified Massilia]MBD8531467.1 hypothetical protein [Massilia sp. CFBP 13647]MBD8673737.1 hypothetical protein [Massilia sp. CFBP 13721]
MKKTTSITNQNAGIVIHGPSGCGKTRNAAALARHYGKSSILDDWTPRPGAKLQANVLALTNESPAPLGAIAFSDAMYAAGLSRRP